MGSTQHYWFKHKKSLLSLTNLFNKSSRLDLHRKLVVCSSLLLIAPLAHADLQLSSGTLAGGTITKGTLKVTGKDSLFRLREGKITGGQLESGTLANNGTLDKVHAKNVTIENAQLEGSTSSDDAVTTTQTYKTMTGDLSDASITGVAISVVTIGPLDESHASSKPTWKGKGFNWKGKAAEQEVDVENPGYFDVGVGFTYLGKVDNNSGATGLLATLKAYPAGRWYAPIKKPSSHNVIQKRVEADTSNNNEAKVAASQALEDYLSYQADLLPLSSPDRNHFCNRLSIFYGHSVGNYDAVNIPTSVNALGFEFDIAPEFAFMVGAAAYQSVGIGNVSETKVSWIIGVQMNTNAFDSMRNFGGN